MGLRTVAVWVPDVPNARVGVHVSANVWRYAMTAANGVATFDNVDEAVGDSDITVEADGYAPYQQHVVWDHIPRDANKPRPLNHQLSVGHELPPLVKLGGGTGHRGPLQHPLQTAGRDFVDPVTGQRVCYPGVDAFLSFQKFRDGGEAALEPFFQESEEFGWVLWRTWFMGAIANNQVLQLDPKGSATFYDDARAYVQCCNRRGIVPL
jgi:hypothetical protein